MKVSSFDLLSGVADISSPFQGSEYGSPLQNASLFGRAGVARLLIEKGADVNGRGEGRALVQAHILIVL